MDAKIGRNSVVVATLLVHSVNVAISRHKTRAIAAGGIVCSGVSFSPSQLDNPES